jgi:rod shape-determining protein MreC
LAQYRSKSRFGQVLSRGTLAFAIVFAVLVYVLGASSDPRLEPLRRVALDISAPVTSFVSAPFRFVRDGMSNMGGYLDVYEQNRSLREDIVQLNQWREVARRFEEENARLRALHNVTLAPKFDYVTAQVVGGSGGGFAHTVTINVGRTGGVGAGAVALDGGGVVGRTVSVGQRAARVLLLTDLASRVPVVIEGAGKKSTDEDEQDEIVRAILVGDSTDSPLLEFPTEIDGIKPGQRVVTSSDGGVFPKDLPVGEVERDGETLRVRLAANFDRLEFVRILLDRTDRSIDADAVLIVSPKREEDSAVPAGSDE